MEKTASICRQAETGHKINLIFNHKNLSTPSCAQRKNNSRVIYIYDNLWSRVICRWSGTAARYIAYPNRRRRLADFEKFWLDAFLFPLEEPLVLSEVSAKLPVPFA